VANTKRIWVGMTAQGVQRRLGNHPLLEGGGPTFTPGTPAISYRWLGPEGDAVVSFDRSGKMAVVEWQPHDTLRGGKSWRVEVERGSAGRRRAEATWACGLLMLAS
jgi:hypothetical protein